MGVGCGVGSSAAKRLLFVHADTFEIDGLAVEQNLLALCLDGTEADAVDDCLAAHVEFDVVAFGIVWRPELQLLGLQRGRCCAFVVGGERLLQFQFGYAEGDDLSGLGFVKSGLEADLTLSLLAQTEFVVLDVDGIHLYQQHVAGNAAIVPPVEDLCRNVLCAPLVVDLHDDHILAVQEQVRDIHVEGRESTYMMPCQSAVHVDVGLVVHGSEVE